MVDVLTEDGEVTKSSCKGRGRPRSEDVDHLILEAVLDVVAEVGITSVSMEGIAARAGVSKASIYRRFDSKDKLTVAAVEYMREQSPEIPTSGTAFERLHGLLDGLRASLPSSRYGRIMVNVLAASNENPALAKLVYERILIPRRARIRELIQEGIDSGEFPSNINIDVAMPILVGPMLYLGMWSMVDPVSETKTIDVLRAVLNPQHQ